MIRNVMEHANLVSFQIAALTIFIGWFGLVFLWIYRKHSKDLYLEMSQLPLNDNIQTKGTKESNL